MGTTGAGQVASDMAVAGTPQGEGRV